VTRSALKSEELSGFLLLPNAKTPSFLTWTKFPHIGCYAPMKPRPHHVSTLNTPSDGREPNVFYFPGLALSREAIRTFFVTAKAK